MWTGQTMPNAFYFFVCWGVLEILLIRTMLELQIILQHVLQTTNITSDY